MGEGNNTGPADEGALLTQELGLEAGESPIEFLSSVLAAVPAFITRTDQDLNIRYINQLIPGIERSQVIGQNVFHFVAPEDHEVARACFEQVKTTRQPGSYEAVASGPDGGQSHYVNYVTPVRDPDGSTGLCIVGIDVSADRKHEAALRHSEEMLRLAIGSTGIGMWNWDYSKGQVVWDERMKAICGVSEPASFEEFSEMIHPDDRAMVNEAIETAMVTGDFKTRPHRINRPDGEFRWVMSVGKILRDEDKPGRMIGGLIDITQQRSVEEQLRQAQKMEAVGNLTAGVAHNFNNMLMVLLPTIDLAKRVVPESYSDMLENAAHAGQRAAEMIRQLMTFSGQSPSVQRESQETESLVAKAVLMAQGLIDRAIQVSSRSHASSSVRCNAGEIEQVILNILLNARDALMAAGTRSPTISICTDLVPVAAVAEKGTPGTDYLRISITDNGPGMTAEVLRQIFEPFFTTKLPQGTGLGLAMSYAIVRDHGGWIDCRSTPGTGTTFEICLPISAEITTPSTGLASEALPAERPRVLVIDDEAPVREITKRVLETHDFPVAVANSAEAARALLETDSNFAVVLLDRSMPGARGVELVPFLRKALPEARIYYFTGEHVPSSAAPEVDGVVQKPLSAEGLIRALQLTKKNGR